MKRCIERSAKRKDITFIKNVILKKIVINLDFSAKRNIKIGVSKVLFDEIKVFIPQFVPD